MVEKVESIQLVMFVHTPAQANALKLWESVTGDEPSGFQTTAPNHTQVTGSFDGIDLTLMVAPTRVDVVVQGPPPSPPEFLPPVIADHERAMDAALSMFAKILPRLSSARAAIVLQGHTPGADVEDAIAKLRGMVPELPVPAHAHEVNYHAVIVKPSEVADHRRIKYICRWETVQMQIFSASGMGVQVVNPSKSYFAGHVYVDVFSEMPEPLNVDPGAGGFKRGFSAGLQDAGWRLQ